MEKRAFRIVDMAIFLLHGYVRLQSCFGRTKPADFCLFCTTMRQETRLFTFDVHVSFFVR